MIALGVTFALIGLSQIFGGKAEGNYGFGVYRQTEPALFWIYIAAHFAIAAWIVVVALVSKPKPNQKT